MGQCMKCGAVLEGTGTVCPNGCPEPQPASDDSKDAERYMLECPVVTDACQCLKCPLFTKEDCPRVDPAHKVMCLQYDHAYYNFLKAMQEFIDENGYIKIGRNDLAAGAPRRMLNV
ncbi:MAG: hypothetical protein KAU20_02405 [Nanoarchaeota archaeon]|nr:hypothetical protein [Nanoarchaeota archaeon]